MDNKILLVVDDEINIGNSVKRSLSLAGYTVFTAHSGQEGLDILEHQNIPVIICDQLMPHMTGTEFLTKVRTLYPNTVRIIFTAYAEFETLSKALDKGDIHRVVPKPWEEEYLIKYLTPAFEQAENPNEQNTTDS